MHETGGKGRSRLRKMLVLALILLLVFGICYFSVCGSLVYVMLKPQRKSPPPPWEIGFPDAEEVSFQSQDRITLRGYFVPSSGDRAIVFVHGAHSHCWDVHAADIARKLSAAGFGVLVFDLRAHGRSEGETLGLGSLERYDVAAAVKFLHSERGFQPGRIGIHGTSYGAATTLLAIPHITGVGAVVSDSAFANAVEVLRAEVQRRTHLPSACISVLTPGARLMGRLVLSLPFDDAPERAVREIKRTPLLLIHGEEDPLVPVEHAKRLKQAAPTAELWLLTDCGHAEGVRLANGATSSTRDAYLNRVTQFFEHHLD